MGFLHMWLITQVAQGHTAKLEAQVSNLREQLHGMFRMAERLREERDDAHTAIDQMAAKHSDDQLQHDQQASETHDWHQVSLLCSPLLLHLRAACTDVCHTVGQIKASEQTTSKYAKKSVCRLDS